MENKEELEALKSRIRQGNLKLNLAWQQLREMTHRTEEWNEQMEKWHRANEKLSLLCTQLKTLGFTECLYLDEKGKKIKSCLTPGNDIGCRVCPSMRAWWDEEFMAL